MLEKVDYTLGMEDMAAGEARARLSPELLRVADCAHGLIVDSIEVTNSLGAGSVETW